VFDRKPKEVDFLLQSIRQKLKLEEQGLIDTADIKTVRDTKFGNNYTEISYEGEVIRSYFLVSDFYIKVIKYN